MLPRIALALLLAGCTVDTGVIPSSRQAERDVEAVHRAEAGDVKDLRPTEPGRPPPVHGAASFAPRF